MKNPSVILLTAIAPAIVWAQLDNRSPNPSADGVSPGFVWLRPCNDYQGIAPNIGIKNRGVTGIEGSPYPMFPPVDLGVHSWKSSEPCTPFQQSTRFFMNPPSIGLGFRSFPSPKAINPPSSDLGLRYGPGLFVLPQPASESTAELDQENNELLEEIKILVNQDEEFLKKYLADEKSKNLTVQQQIQSRKHDISILKAAAAARDRRVVQTTKPGQ